MDSFLKLTILRRPILAILPDSESQLPFVFASLKLPVALLNRICSARIETKKFVTTVSNCVAEYVFGWSS
jgi:hypothetical protein